MENQNDSRTETQAPETSRRQVIRGMAAVPVVLTLTSGAASANDSSLQCLGPDKFRPLLPDLDQDGCAVTNPSRQLISEPEYSGLSSDLYDNGNGSAVFQFNSADGKYCPLYVDSAGNISSDPNSGGDPTTASCLNSFA